MIKSEEELRRRAEKYLPKGIPASAIADVECDPYDGGDNMDKPSYWVYLSSGWICRDMECHVIHEDTLKDLKIVMQSIERWDDDPDLLTYSVCSYYGIDFRGLSESELTNDCEKAKSLAHEWLMKGNFVILRNRTTGMCLRLEPDKYEKDFNGEFPYLFE